MESGWVEHRRSRQMVLRRKGHVGSLENSSRVEVKSRTILGGWPGPVVVLAVQTAQGADSPWSGPPFRRRSIKPRRLGSRRSARTIRPATRRARSLRPRAGRSVLSCSKPDQRLGTWRMRRFARAKAPPIDRCRRGPPVRSWRPMVSTMSGVEIQSWCRVRPELRRSVIRPACCPFTSIATTARRRFKPQRLTIVSSNGAAIGLVRWIATRAWEFQRSPEVAGNRPLQDRIASEP